MHIPAVVLRRPEDVKRLVRGKRLNHPGQCGADAAVRAFVGAGPMALAMQHSGERVVASAVQDALSPHTGTDGRVTLPGWYRVVVTQG